ncbi:MAG: tyrosine-type recombinase/integrase [Lachnospiraceae bacterium]|nr:tyrosine-type recombinase/integrase [Lachnospiraceae bacterium]
MERLVDRYLKYLREAQKVSKNTYASYRRDLKKLIQFFNQKEIMDISEVESATIQEYLDYLKDRGYAVATITRNFMAVRSFFRYLYNDGHIKGNPSEWIHLPKAISNPNTVLCKEEMEALLKQPTGMSFKGLRDRAMLLLLYDTKISISELVNLKVNEIHFSQQEVRLQGQFQNRLYTFQQETKDALKDHIRYAELKEDDWLFPNRYGTPMSRQGFWKIVKNYAKEAGIKKEITLYSIKQGEV